MRILVNASTISIGGGVQQAIGFVEYAAALEHPNTQFFFALSRSVFDTITPSVRLDPRIRLITEPVAGPWAGRHGRRRLLDLEKEFAPNVVFSIGYPSYVKFRSPEIGQYTNGWDFCEFPEAWKSLTAFQRGERMLRTAYRRRWARRAAYYQTQTEVAKAGIVRSLGIEPQRVFVLPNSPDPRFQSGPAPPPDSTDVRVFCLAAAYRHKNLSIIPAVAEHLAQVPGRQHRFVLTLPSDSSLWREIAAESSHRGVSERIDNIGPLTLDQCVEEYRRSACVFLPTLAEIFSATYLEAMAMGVPIVTSDLDFAKDVCGNAALYYDCASSRAAADAILSVTGRPAVSDELILNGHSRLGAFPDNNQKHRLLMQWLQQTASGFNDAATMFAEGSAVATQSDSAIGAVSSSRVKNSYRICTQCVMDTTDSRITFDAHGVCDHCRTFERDIQPHWRHSEGDTEQLEKVVEAMRRQGRGREFDCIIGVSGGVDSSYLTYIATKKLGLRPLVFHVDTGWNSQESVHNIERLIDGLGLELFTEVIDWREMRDLQLAFFKAGVPHIDAPQDHAIFAAMYRYAYANGVKVILTGGNYSTECIRNPIEWMYFQSDSAQLTDIHRKFGTVELKTFPTTNILWHKVYLPYINGVRVTRLLDLLPYRKDEAAKELQDALGWRPYPQKHFESRFTAFYEGFWLFRKFGFDVRRVQLSSLILTGQMCREDALAALEKPPMDDVTASREFEYVSSKLSISSAELRHYFDAPNKSHRDYRSQAWLYRLGGFASRTAGLERGGKR